jgi:hypothetical protein
VEKLASLFQGDSSPLNQLKEIFKEIVDQPIVETGGIMIGTLARLLLAACLTLVLPVIGARAQDSFYNGKTVRIIVGAAAGGGYDTYSRTIARHIGKHVPGNPTFIVENMPGAGFLISANYMYKVAKPDGLTIGHFIGGLFLQQLLGKPGIEFDAAKFEYIGVPTQDDYVIGISKKIRVFPIWTSGWPPRLSLNSAESEPARRQTIFPRYSRKQ